jgi:hypothetical protein
MTGPGWAFASLLAESNARPQPRVPDWSCPFITRPDRNYLVPIPTSVPLRRDAGRIAYRPGRVRTRWPDKIGAAAGRILACNHGHRCYGWAYEDGVFRFFEHPVHFTREQADEGKYVIQTEEQNLSEVDAVRLYNGAIGSRARLRRPQGCSRHAAGLSPHREPRRGVYVAALACRFTAHRKEAQGRAAEVVAVRARNRPSDISRTCAADGDGFAGIATAYSASRLLRVPGRAA